jgi:carboxymethylenebutenolidase
LSADSEADWKKGLCLYNAFDYAAGVNDIATTMDVARSLRGATGKVGLMGFCFGGLLTFLTTVRRKVDASVDYYGAGVEKYLDEAVNLKTPLMIHLGEEDEFISKEAQQAIINALRNNSHAQVFSYPGQSHAFARHRGSHYDRDAAAIANARSVAFFDLHLRPSGHLHGSGNSLAEDPLGMWVA